MKMLYVKVLVMVNVILTMINFIIVFEARVLRLQPSVLI
jgi:hypothetical protein